MLSLRLLRLLSVSEDASTAFGRTFVRARSARVRKNARCPGWHPGLLWQCLPPRVVRASSTLPRLAHEACSHAVRCYRSTPVAQVQPGDRRIVQSAAKNGLCAITDAALKGPTPCEHHPAATGCFGMFAFVIEKVSRSVECSMIETLTYSPRAKQDTGVVSDTV